MASSVSVSALHAEQYIEDLEIDLLLEGTVRQSGHDFRGYLREPLRQRLHALLRQQGVDCVSALQAQVMHDPEAARELLRTLYRNASSLFGEPSYYRILREQMVPWLRSMPVPRIWIAECVAAEDVCSLAIVLAEEGLHDRTQIFATAADESLLHEARRGEFAAERVEACLANYRDAGGKGSLLGYFSESAGRLKLSEALLGNIVWAQHSLMTDASFNEFQLIVCRHAFSQFGPALRSRVLELFRNSLPMLGVVALPTGDPSPQVLRSHCYKALSVECGLFQRIC